MLGIGLYETYRLLGYLDFCNLEKSKQHQRSTMASGDSNENSAAENVSFSDTGKTENTIFNMKSDYLTKCIL